MTYSNDLRIKALDCAEKCGSKHLAAQIFGVTPRTLFNWAKRKRQGSLTPKLRQPKPRKIEHEKLKTYLQDHPDAYLREIAEVFKVSTVAIFYACKRLKITLKKRHPSTKKGMRRKERTLSRS